MINIEKPSRMSTSLDSREERPSRNRKGNPSAVTSSYQPDSRNESLEEVLRLRPYSASAFSHVMSYLKEGMVALDLGCGGEMHDLRILHSYGCALSIGIDMIKGCHETAKRLDIAYIRSDIDESDLPIASSSCDVVVMNNIIEHLHDPMRTLIEATRALREEGILVVITPNHADLKNRVLLLIGESVHFPLQRWLFEGEDRIRRGTRTVFLGHVREYTLRELTEMVRLSGLEIVHVEYLATASTGLSRESRETEDFAQRADRIARRSRLAFRAYSLMEKAVPQFRAQISVIAKKSRQS